MIPFVTITLDRPYECRFDYSTSMRYQQITGKSMSSIGMVDMDNMP